MIYSIMHKGSGLGNQLHRYVALRALAMAKNESFGVIAPDLFKGSSFVDIDMGNSSDEYEIEYPSGKVIPKIEGKILDGEFQNEAIFGPITHLINEWLPVEELDIPDDVCVINFRGGEYTAFPELFLPKEYWDMAIKEMLEIDENMVFEVHTDDQETAKQFFPDFNIIQNISLNWRSIKYAKYLILSNSSFAILPAYLSDAELIIAPKYWARYNTKEWINPDNATYSKFKYIHHEEDSSKL